MTHAKGLRSIGVGAVVAAAVIVSAVGCAQRGRPVSLSGTIDTISGSALTVTGDNGTKASANIGSKTLIVSRVDATIDDIQKGQELGVAANKESDGSYTATFISIFSPEFWKRVRHGQFPMASGETMTNAPATYFATAGTNHTLKMRVGSKTITIAVPDSAQITRLVAAKSSDLAVGERIEVRGSRRGSGPVRASIVIINKQTLE